MMQVRYLLIFGGNCLKFLVAAVFSSFAALYEPFGNQSTNELPFGLRPFWSCSCGCLKSPRAAVFCGPAFAKWSLRPGLFLPPPPVPSAVQSSLLLLPRCAVFWTLCALARMPKLFCLASRAVMAHFNVVLGAFPVHWCFCLHPPWFCPQRWITGSRPQCALMALNDPLFSFCRWVDLLCSLMVGLARAAK